MKSRNKLLFQKKEMPLFIENLFELLSISTSAIRFFFKLSTYFSVLIPKNKKNVKSTQCYKNKKDEGYQLI